ncbi:MAG: 2'-5' RNA ligase family protein [Chitinophagaceae bacterium]|jgi:2'-5' RNA ligase|nr:2'-5' RNA ligase family protein [Chitinophagaceae bacterium]
MYNFKEKRKFNQRPPFKKNFDKPRRAPLPEGFSLFYIAIECPQHINERVDGMKAHMEKQYGCRAARKSPAHLTIVPPFRAEDELIKQLQDFVTTFNIGMVPFQIRLKDYGQFAERVLFVDVERPNEPLNALERECMQEFAEQFPGIIFGMKPDFNPHVTLATRDIPEGKLAESRQYFEANFPFDEQFEAKSLTLYKLDKGWWQAV